MAQSSSFFSRVRTWLSRSGEDGGDTRLKVVNRTRETTLACSVEVAESGPKRNKGLLGRKSLEPGTGLWIVPCEAVHTFWMQFPIDLVFLDRKSRIAKIRSGVGPWRVSACLSAHSVLELPSGTIRESLAELGDAIEFLPAASQAETT